ncbi:MAG: FKBP-type peptidyl-prolyl cis-trans isomerase, partial [Bacteroidota bacterium]
FLVLLLVVVTLQSCTTDPSGKTPPLLKTAGGLEYYWIKKSAPVKAEFGDLMALRMRLYAGDSCLYDGSVSGQPFWVQLNQSAYKGSIQEGLALMGRGDSACFYPVADSVFKFDLGIPKPDWVPPGSRLKLEVGVHRIRNEEGEITTFMGQQGIPDSCRTAAGAVRWKPNAPKTSKTKSGLLQNGVKYRLVGRMQSLNGQVIRAFTDQEPYYFVQGQDQIKPEGLGALLSSCSPGDSIWIVLPSSEAYGKQSLPEVGLEPYTTLYFQLRILPAR